MEFSNDQPPDPYSQSGSLGALPARPKRPGRTAAIVVASVVGVALVVGLAIAGVLAVIDRTRDEAEESRQFTSSDGTFTMTLPAGWGDETEAYRAGVLEKSGTESTIEGFATVDGLPWSLTDNFVSMSGHPVGPVPESAEEIGSADLANWREDFDDYTELASATFTTDAGDSVWHGGLRGTTDGEEWLIVVATVVGDGSLARFDLELRPPYYDASEAFLESLRSLVFAPTDTDDDVAQDFAPESDGRTYSSERGASIIVPATWTHIPLDADAAAFDPTTAFDFLGLWQIAPGPQGGYVTVSLTAGERERPLREARDQLIAQFGEVGDKTVDGDGITYTVLGLEDWPVPGITQSAWIEVRADYGATGVEGYEGLIRGRRCYYLAAQMEQLVACVEADVGDLEGATTAVESALLTVEFAR